MQNCSPSSRPGPKDSPRNLVSPTRRTGAAALLAGLLALVLPLSTHAKVLDGFTDAPLATGAVTSPTAMAFAPDGRLFVCQQNGQLRVIKNGALLATPFLSVTVNSNGERGLLGVAFDPGFATNHYVYVYYTATTPTLHNRVSRFTAQGDVAVAGSERILLELDTLIASNHNGGCLRFGLDGKLYIATGDNARTENSQTLANLLGKMLRLNPDGTIPTDNPFYTKATGKNRAIWALGLRNPFSFAIQPGTGKIFINDVGQSTREEVNLGKAGANYGWPACEGDCSPSNASYVNPVLSYGHGSGLETGYAITGGAFYNPAVQQYPSLYRGYYFFADYGSGWIRMMDPAKPGTSQFFAGGILNPVDLQVGPDGVLYFLCRGDGKVYGIRYSLSQPPSIVQAPANQTVNLGSPATFTVVASGSATLQYQWQRGTTSISGATGASYTLASASAADDGATFRCVVTNPYGTATSASATLKITANKAPTATITSPALTQLYQAGETITFAGSGTDPEDGTLAATSASWTVVFHHDTHTHPFLGPLDGTLSGTFVVPTEGETSANVWFRLYLTVTDSKGVATTTYRDLSPRTSRLTLAASTPGLQLTLDGQPAAAPYTLDNVVGMRRSIGAPLEQYLAGGRYRFVSWSDGGGATHAITAAATDTTLTALYQANRAPVARDDSYSLTAGASFAVPSPGVTGNDTDADGDPVVATLVSGPSSGSLTWNGDGSFVYSATAGFAGTDSFTYQLSDGAATSAPATVLLIVGTSSVVETPVPTGVTANDGVYRQKVRVVWSRVDSLETPAYRVSRATSAGGLKEAITGWIKATGFDDTSGIPGVTYYYSVQAAVNEQGDAPSNYSEENAGWRALSPPDSVVASDGAYGDKVALTWPPAWGASHYRVSRATSSTGTKTLLSDWDTLTSFADTSAKPGTTYYYFVQSALNSAGSRLSGYSVANSGLRTSMATATTSGTGTGATRTLALAEEVLAEPQISSIRLDSTGERVIAVYVKPGLRYTLEASTDLVFWEEVSTTPERSTAATEVLEFSDPSPAPLGRFYRVTPRPVID